MAPSDPACAIDFHDDVHDLRNLFGVVASSAHLMQDMALPDRASLLLYAIDQAAMRGGEISTRLLGRVSAPRAGSNDLNSRIAELMPAFDGLVGPRIALETRLCAAPLPIDQGMQGIEDVLIELVWNARRAIGDHGVIQLRTRRIGARAWVLVADTGCGLDDQQLSMLRRRALQGNGLSRIKRWADRVGCRFRLRSRAGCGTIVMLDLPLAPGIAMSSRRGRREPVAA